MAINSKTRIGGDSGEQADRMIRAGAQGAEIRQRANDAMIQQRQANAQTIQQGASQLVQAQQFNESQAQQQGQFDQQMQFQRDQSAQRHGEFEENLDLKGAKAGFERDKRSDRAAKLEQEMQRGSQQGSIGALDSESQNRLKDQASKPMEMDSQGKWHPSEFKQQEQRIDKFKADTERMRARAYQQQVGISAQKNLAKGDMAAYKENAKQLANLPNSGQKRYDRLMKGDVNSNDWGELEKMAEGGPDADPSLMNDIKAKNFSPRVAQFTRAMVARDSLQSIVFSKGDTQELDIDWTNPKMVEFQQQRNNISAFMKASPALGSLAFINSTQDKMRFLNVLAASQVLHGMTQAPSPAGGMTPATSPMGGGQQAAQQGQPEVQHSMGVSTPQNPDMPTQAVQRARAGGANPQQALEAGANARRPQQPWQQNFRGIYGR